MQRTLKSEVVISGKGLHSGNESTITIKPLEANKGILFKRTDIENAPLISVKDSGVINFEKSKRMTCLSKDGVEIFTTEHLLASLTGLGIDNALIEVKGEEIPGVDGSSLPFVKAIQESGIVEQDQPKKYYTVKETIVVQDGDAMLVVTPSEEFKISYVLDFQLASLPQQHQTFVCNDAIFTKELAPARTFCLEKEAEYLLRKGFGKGANYDNTVVLKEDGTVVNNVLRFEDECVRHKLADLVGDLSLLGYRLKAHVTGIKSGHFLNMKLVEKLKSEMNKNESEYSAHSSYKKEDASLEVFEILAGKKEGIVLDNIAIQKILPHRFPFLLVDKLVITELDKKAVGIKNVTCNEQFFCGHFPGLPVMPGVLILEAMAQVAGTLILYNTQERGKIAYFMSIDGVKFRKTVVPGDQLVMKIEILKRKSRVGHVETKAYVDGKLVCEANMKFSLG